jgi:hypothetical protein
VLVEVEVWEGMRCNNRFGIILRGFPYFRSYRSSVGSECEVGSGPGGTWDKRSS